MEEQKTSPKTKSNNTLVILLIIVVILLTGISTYLFFINQNCKEDKELLQTQLTEALLDVTEDNLETEIEQEEYVNEVLSIPTSTAEGSTEYYLSTKLPLDGQVIEESRGITKIEFNNSYLEIMVSDISVPETVMSYVDIDNGNLLSLFRVIDQSDRIFYTSNLRTVEDCVEVGAMAPCGALAVEVNDGNNNTLYFNVEFVGDESDLEIADSIVSNLEFLREE
jgi:hypothetical protein